MTAVEQGGDPIPRRSTRPTRRTVAALFVVAALCLTAAWVPVVGESADAATPSPCSSSFQIDKVLPSGARWQMCWELRSLTGVVLREVTYTPPGGEAVMVLGAMNLAQIHVPYDDNQFRFHDVSDFGLGLNMNDLQPADCPGGEVLKVGPDPVLCQQVRGSGYAYKAYDEQAQASTLSLFSVSHIGAYNYIVAWNFDDDGTIRPEIGATGRLQRYGGVQSTGWDVGQGRYAVAHLHNYYWRLDFDIDGPGNDKVQELAATIGSGRQTFTNQRTAFNTEVARRVLPGSFRSWRVRDTVTKNADGHPISYELQPSTDNIFRGPAYEPFTHNELYVTRNNTCEVFASHNPTAGGCGSDLASFVNGASLNNTDPVLWYGTSFHHLPRDEDEEHMDVHWSGFSIVPRDLTATYPIP